MRKFAIILTSATLAFSAMGCQAWGSSSTTCCKKCNKCTSCKKCHKRNNCSKGCRGNN